ALCYRETVGEYDEIYAVMLKKLGIKTPVTKLSDVATEDQFLGLSGSDLEAVLVRATLEAEAAGSAEVAPEHLKKALGDFIPPANSREREMQILVAVLESTSRELLPERFRTLDRGEVQARIPESKRELRLAWADGLDPPLGPSPPGPLSHPPSHRPGEGEIAA